jgi:hypothetical protein
MNLVQINERLKDLPMQVVQQYANGMNPEVPPYLALGELQRRELTEKQAAATQGGTQGPQASIKEQLEQKAGLMALQQAQQQQMQPQQPSGPMPVPAGVPQPQAQPQAPQPTMMARGGLASIPVRRDMFDYAGGGIVAFAGGGGARVHPQAQLIEFLKQLGLTPEEFTKAPPKVQNEIRDMMRAGVPASAPAPASAAPQAAKGSMLRSINPAGVAGYGLGLYHGELGSGEQEELERRRAMAPTIDSNAAPNATEETMKRVGPMTAPKFKDPRRADAGLPGAAKQMGAPAAAPQPPAPAAGAPAQQAGLPGALPARSPYFDQVNADLAKPIAAPTPEGVIAEQKALSPEAMQEDFMKKRMEEQRGRAAGERAAFEGSRPSGLDDLIRVFGQAGQYKGLSGTGPAYTANQDRKRAEELAMEQRQNQLLTGIDTREYEGGKELFGARSKAMDTANKSFQDRLKSRSEVLAQMAGVDQRAMDSALDRQTQVQLQGMRDAAAKLERSSPGKGERMLAEVLALRAAGKNAEADRIIETINALEGRGGKEDTLSKEIAKKKVDIAAMPDNPLKQQMLASLAALEGKPGGGVAAQAGKVPPPPPGFKLN